MAEMSGVFGAEDDFAYFNKYQNFEKNGIPIIDDGYELSWGLASLTQRELIEEILGSFEYDYLLENNMVVKVDDVYDEGLDNLGDLFGAEEFEATKGMDTYSQPFSELKIKPTKTKVGILLATVVAGGLWYSKKMKEE